MKKEKENFLRGIRYDKKLTLKMVAKEVGISWTYLQQLETGHRKGNLDIINKILKFYGYRLSVCRIPLINKEIN